ncbi:SURF1 family protein [Actinomarinicola tropica]|uniref:SURF1 family protein n=1 Tax=Actinomarinicola tropica TaxID=2789776 RepID=UPI001897BF7F|nr:SURF1 family protein [Actinomarinicola tropica]
MYRFALRPRWILSHLLALAVVVVCIGAGIWQLDRLDQKRTAIDRYDEMSALPTVPVGDLLGPDTPEDAVDELVHRRVSATGTYLVDEQVTVRNRTLDGAPGHWVLTPVLLDDGTAVVVNRGWVPMAVLEDLSTAAPPTGEVEVVGTLSATQERGTFGAVDAAEGRIVDFARADIGRLAAQIDVPVLPAYVTLEGQVPDTADVPVPVEPIEPDEGPHLGYAAQWFIFAAIAAVGYPLILRKVARDRAAEAAADGAPRVRRRSAKVPVDD